MAEDKPEEHEPKSAEEITAAASAIIDSLQGERFTVEEAICVLALASSLVQIEMTMQLILKKAKVVAMPIPPPNVTFQKPGDN